MCLSSFESASQVLDNMMIAALFGQTGPLPDKNTSIPHHGVLPAFDFHFRAAAAAGGVGRR